VLSVNCDVLGCEAMSHFDCMPRFCGTCAVGRHFGPEDESSVFRSVGIHLQVHSASQDGGPHRHLR
jgi:hypothetical protein